MNRPTLLTAATAILLLWSSAAAGALAPLDALDRAPAWPASHPAPASHGHDNDTHNGTGNQTGNHTFLPPDVWPPEKAASSPAGAVVTESFSVRNPDNVSQAFSYALRLPAGWQGRVLDNGTTYAPSEARTVRIEFTSPSVSRGDAVLVVSGKGGDDTGVVRACFHGPNATGCDPEAAPQPPVVAPNSSYVSGGVGETIRFAVAVTNPSDLDLDVRVSAQTPRTGWRVTLDAHDPHFAPGETKVLHGSLVALAPGDGNVTVVARSAEGVGAGSFDACASLPPLHACDQAAPAAAAASGASPGGAGGAGLTLRLGLAPAGLAGEASVRILQ